MLKLEEGAVQSGFKRTRNIKRIFIKTVIVKLSSIVTQNRLYRIT